MLYYEGSEEDTRTSESTAQKLHWKKSVNLLFLHVFSFFFVKPGRIAHASRSLLSSPAASDPASVVKPLASCPPLERCSSLWWRRRRKWELVRTRRQTLANVWLSRRRKRRRGSGKPRNKSARYGWNIWIRIYGCIHCDINQTRGSRGGEEIQYVVGRTQSRSVWRKVVRP